MKLIHKKLLWLIGISIAFISTSCTNKLNNKFWWEAGISAPKYYPIAGNVDFIGCAGNGSNVSFDNGWGNSYGAIVSGNKYKNLPKQVYIEYYSVVDAKDFKGTVPLPYDRIVELFNQYCIDKEKDEAHLVVGMAPGGWIRVWADFTSNQNGVLLIEVAKAQLKEYDSGRKRDQVIDDENWGKYYTYWQHFGVPNDVWAENEKEYNLYLNFSKPNIKNLIFSEYSSLDGTLYYGDWKDDPEMTSKLPADLIIRWRTIDDLTSYDTHILIPKDFYKIVASKKTNKIEIALEIEKDEKYGVLYLIANDKKEKILRFKSEKSKNSTLGDSNFCENIEYFIK